MSWRSVTSTYKAQVFYHEQNGLLADTVSNVLIGINFGIGVRAVKAELKLEVKIYLKSKRPSWPKWHRYKSVSLQRPYYSVFMWKTYPKASWKLA